MLMFSQCKAVYIAAHRRLCSGQKCHMDKYMSRTNRISNIMKFSCVLAFQYVVVNTKAKPSNLLGNKSHIRYNKWQMYCPLSHLYCTVTGKCTDL